MFLPGLSPRFHPDVFSDFLPEFAELSPSEFLLESLDSFRHLPLRFSGISFEIIPSQFFSDISTDTFTKTFHRFSVRVFVWVPPKTYVKIFPVISIEAPLFIHPEIFTVIMFFAKFPKSLF